MKRPPPASLASSGAVSGSFSSLRSSPPSFFFCLGSRSSVLSAPSSAAFSLPLPPPRLFFPYPFCFLSFFSFPLHLSPHFSPSHPPSISPLVLSQSPRASRSPPHTRPQIIKIPSQGAKPGCGRREGSERAGARSSAASRSAVRSERRPPGSRPESSLQ